MYERTISRIWEGACAKPSHDADAFSQDPKMNEDTSHVQPILT